MTAPDLNPERMDELAEALGAHFVMWHDLSPGGPSGEWRCQCGKKFGFSDSAIQHVAAALAPLPARWLAEPEEEVDDRALLQAEERGLAIGAAEVRARVESLMHPERGMGVSAYGDGRRFFDEADVRAALATTEEQR